MALHAYPGDRTIHSMVYNAMKMFMEINPQLFDDCSHEYTEMQNSAQAREQQRQDRWKKLEDLAKERKDNPPPSTPSGSKPKFGSEGPPSSENADPSAQETRQRLRGLRLEDEGASPTKERRSQERDGQQNPVSLSPIG